MTNYKFIIYRERVEFIEKKNNTKITISLMTCMTFSKLEVAAQTHLVIGFSIKKENKQKSQLETLWKFLPLILSNKIDHTIARYGFGQFM